MDRHALIQKLKETLKARKKAVIIGSVGSLTLVLGLSVGIHLAHRSAKTLAQAPAATAKAEVAKKAMAPVAQPAGPQGLSGLVERYAQAFDSVQHEVDELRTAETENERLKLENTNLRLKLEAKAFDCHAGDAASRTRELELKLTQETGAKVGRTLATIGYRPPTHLLPPQLYTLGMTYFKAREDEKAAVIFTFLTGLADNDAFKTPRNFLLTGVAWYRLDNYELAEHYFNQVLEFKEIAENAKYQAQARLWQALAFERSKRHSDAQRWLRDLIDHHPHSTESAWVNSTEAGREPASDDSP